MTRISFALLSLAVLSALSFSASQDVTKNMTQQHASQDFVQSFSRNRSQILHLMSEYLRQYGTKVSSASNSSKDNFQGMEDSIGRMVQMMKPLLQTTIQRSLREYGVSQNCQEDMMLTLTGIFDGKEWALRMLDSFGKPSSELLNLHTKWLGSYKECTDITATIYSNQTLHLDPVDHFHGKYCRIKASVGSVNVMGKEVKPELDIGSCVPDSCTATDIQGLIFAGARAVNNKTVKPPAEVECQKKKQLQTDAIAVICLLSVLGFFIVLGTVYDIITVQLRSEKEPEQQDIKDTPQQLNGQLQDYNVDYKNAGVLNGGFVGDSEGPNKTMEAETVIGTADAKTIIPDIMVTKTVEPKLKPAERGTVEKMLLSFSVYTNGVKILSAQQAAGSLGAVNGIRFLSMGWVILGHTYFFSQSYDENLLQFFMGQMNNWTFMAIPSATVSVDTFFALSGLLVGYLTLKELKKVGGATHLNWFMFYFHRFWRLTPPYMLVIMVYTVLMKYWFLGPQWPQDNDSFSSTCSENWWVNLLYVNNLVRVDKMCMAWSWYLSNDMQFYILSPLILVPLFYQVIVGGVISLLFLVATVTTSALIALNHKYPAQLFSPHVPPPADMDWAKNMYLPCYTRMGPYIIGLVTGYLLYRMKCKCRIPKMVNLFCWLLCIGICCAVIYGGYTDGDSHIFSLDESVAYQALSRTGWGVVVCWIVFACATGHGGWVNEILSWKPFVPLGRLTYMAYLVHPIVMINFYASRERLVYFTNYELIYLFLAHTVMSYGVGFLTSLAFEAPMMGLEKALFRRDKRS